MTPSGDDAIGRAAELLANRIGLRVTGSTRGRLTRALRDGAADCAVTFDEHVELLFADRRALERLIDRITVQETRFFRDPDHFDVLIRCALPRLPGGGLVWSAGCANGQEAWSLAIALEEAGASGWYVLATDVSRTAVERARAGIYSERELRELSPAHRALYMSRRSDGRWEVRKGLRARVRVQAHNLVEDPPPRTSGACRIVFCRNVLIYLDADATARALGTMRQVLSHDGWLFLGAAETTAAHCVDFVAERVAGSYVYRPLAARPAPAAREPPAHRHAAAPRSRRERAGCSEESAPPTRLPGIRELLAEGEAHAAAGRFDVAATAFRKAVYLAPEDPVAQLRLGLALEHGSDAAAATRAFRAARAALIRAGTGVPEHHGWRAEELARLIDGKLALPPQPGSDPSCL